MAGSSRQGRTCGGQRGRPWAARKTADDRTKDKERLQKERKDPVAEIKRIKFQAKRVLVLDRKLRGAEAAGDELRAEALKAELESALDRTTRRSKRWSLSSPLFRGPRPVAAAAARRTLWKRPPRPPAPTARRAQRRTTSRRHHLHRQRTPQPRSSGPFFGIATAAANSPAGIFHWRDPKPEIRIRKSDSAAKVRSARTQPP